MIHQKSNRFYLTAITLFCLVLQGLAVAFQAEATVETRNLFKGRTVNNFIAQYNRVSPSAKEKIQAVLDLSIKAINEENIEVYMTTISKNSPQYSISEKLLVYLCREYDLKYEVNETEFVSISANEAQVKITQTTTKIKGPAFRDNKAVLIHVLRKEGDQWKFYSTILDSVKYLN